MRSIFVTASLTILFFLSQKVASAQDPVGLLFAAPDAIKLISEYLGIIESLDSKFERLLDADLKTAISLFEQARANPDKSADFVRSARIYYTRAAEVQADSMDESRRHKRAVALLGLYACCKAESDNPNAERALRKISEIPSKSSFSLQLKYELRPANLAVRAITLVPLKFPVTEQDLRDFSDSFDRFLSIQESVNRHLLKDAKVRRTTP